MSIDEKNQTVELEQTNETVEAAIETEATPQTEPDWKAEALKWRGIAQRNKKKVDSESTKPQSLPEKKEVDEDIRTTVSQLALAEKKRQFGYEHGLSPEETDAIFRFNTNPTKDDLEQPFIKAGLEGLRSKKRVESATPSPSSKSLSVGGKSFSEMSSEERQKNWDKLVKKVR